MKLKTVLGFDFGTCRIGVAVGQTVTRTASALPPLSAKEGIPDWQQLAQLIAQWQPDALVVGIPYHMDGTESPMSQRARKFGRRLQSRFHVPFYQVDERLSSVEAQDWAAKLGHSKSIDSMAAQLILESWLHTSL